MDPGKLQQLDKYRWTAGGRGDSAPVMFYGSAALLKTMDDKVLEQITNVANLPGIVGPAMTMPDAHWGYGFPIGGVAAFDPDAGGIVSAGGVGFDISCGIRCLRTNLSTEDVRRMAHPLADALFKRVPAGLGKGGAVQLTVAELDEALVDGASWAVRAGYGEPSDLEFVEERGRMAGAEPENVSPKAKDRQLAEIGSLGSGNHYAEVQGVERVYDAPAAEAYGIAEGDVIVSIHCGSRGLGHQIGTDYLVKLAKAAKRLGIPLPDRELACAPINSSEGQEYLGAMRAGINCALANRQVITHLAREAFDDVFPEARLETLYDVSHNTCKAETHEVDGKARELFIHRKGATRAFGPGHPALPERYRAVGQPVIVGGSMGTASYILAGAETSEAAAWSSASHGAGRSMSRRQATKQWSGRTLVDELAAQGIVIRSPSMRGIAEEAPGSYKDVHEVARATEQGGLARRVAELRPLVCVKG